MIDPRNTNPNSENVSKGRPILPLLLSPADFRAFDATRKALYSPPYSHGSWPGSFPTTTHRASILVENISWTLPFPREYEQTVMVLGKAVHQGFICFVYSRKAGRGRNRS